MQEFAKLAAEGLALQGEEIVQTTANDFMQFEDSGGGRFGNGRGTWLIRMPCGPGRASVAPSLYRSQRRMKASRSAVALVIAACGRSRYEVVWLAGGALKGGNNKEPASIVVSGNATPRERQPRRTASTLSGGMNVAALAVDRLKPSACHSTEFLVVTPGTYRGPLVDRVERLAGKANVAKLAGNVDDEHVARCRAGLGRVDGAALAPESARQGCLRHDETPSGWAPRVASMADLSRKRRAARSFVDTRGGRAGRSPALRVLRKAGHKAGRSEACPETYGRRRRRFGRGGDRRTGRIQLNRPRMVCNSV